MKNRQPLRLSWIAALLIVVILYRIFVAEFGDENHYLLNTAPLMAMAFGGGLLLGARFFWVPAILLILSDLALGMGTYTVFNAIFYIAVAFVGAAFCRSGGKSWLPLWLGTLTCSLVFYLAGNTFSWAGSPLYPSGLAGWWQAQTTGLLHVSPPSWVFLRNALVGDTIWCLIAAPLFFWKPVSVPQKEAV